MKVGAGGTTLGSFLTMEGGGFEFICCPIVMLGSISHGIPTVGIRKLELMEPLPWDMEVGDGGTVLGRVLMAKAMPWGAGGLGSPL